MPFKKLINNNKNRYQIVSSYNSKLLNIPCDFFIIFLKRMQDKQHSGIQLSAKC